MLHANAEARRRRRQQVVSDKAFTVTFGFQARPFVNFIPAALWINPLVALRSFFVCARKLAQKHTSLPEKARLDTAGVITLLSRRGFLIFP
jgi:hypothetical protein